eukprot:3438641-Pyramimonas_sp.AAC.1
MWVVLVADELDKEARRDATCHPGSHGDITCRPPRWDVVANQVLAADQYQYLGVCADARLDVFVPR